MNAKFSEGPKGELVTLSGGFLGKDEVVRPATDEDRFRFGEEYAEFRKSLEPKVDPPPPAASDGASSAAAAAGADAAGAGDTKPPSVG